MYKWNPVFNFCMNVKRKYIEIFGNPEYHEYTIYPLDETVEDREVYLRKEITCLEYWIEKLFPFYPEFKDKVKYLEINQKGKYVLIRYGKFSSVGGRSVRNYSRKPLGSR